MGGVVDSGASAAAVGSVAGVVAPPRLGIPHLRAGQLRVGGDWEKPEIIAVYATLCN